MSELQHITAEQIAEYGVVAAPDRLTGKANDNKMIFDRLVRELVAVVVNEIIDTANELLTQEDTREENEAGRVAAENLRVSAENLRISAEEERINAEEERINAEEERESSETLRQQAETSRENTTNGIVAQATAQSQAAASSAASASQSASSASAYSSSANQYAANALASQKAIENMTVSVKTLQPGSNATVEKTMVGNSVNLQYGIPRGEKGEKGEKGDGFKILGYYTTLQELQSAVLSPDAGDAYGVGSGLPYDIYIWSGTEWINNGPIQGAKGDPGEDGKSPYEVAVEGGFQGTESAFNDALVNVGSIGSVLDQINGEII